MIFTSNNDTRNARPITTHYGFAAKKHEHPADELKQGTVTVLEVCSVKLCENRGNSTFSFVIREKQKLYFYKPHLIAENLDARNS